MVLNVYQYVYYKSLVIQNQGIYVIFFNSLERCENKFMTKKPSQSVHLRLNDDLLEHVDRFTEKFYFK